MYKIRITNIALEPFPEMALRFYRLFAITGWTLAMHFLLMLYLPPRSILNVFGIIPVMIIVASLFLLAEYQWKKLVRYVEMNCESSNT